MSGPAESVEEFFRRISSDYTARIARCVPRYTEMLGMLLDYLPAALVPRRILELGAGTGNLTLLLAERFPAAEVVAVDLSPELLKECRGRLPPSARVSFRVEDFRELDVEGGSVDLCVSSIALHHLTDREKRELFARVRGFLSPAGVLAYCDQCSGATPETYARHMDRWRAHAESQGVSAAEWEDWMVHQRQSDHHAPVPDQLQWLKAAGFPRVDVVWRHLLWAVFLAEKEEPSG